MSNGNPYDVVIVGAGVAGALMAKHLTHAGLRVLLLEAGPATAWSYEGYARHLEHFYTTAAKGPESAWPPAANAPQPDTGDLPRNKRDFEKSNNGYFVQRGPDPFGSSYSRLQGGSTLHWLGVSLRMLPEDFRLRSQRGVGLDWPLSYDELEPYYRRAEHDIGVSADVAEQRHHGLTFPDGYDYPMQRIPPSYSDQVLARAVDGMAVSLGQEQFELKVRSYPAARNSLPRGNYQPVGAVDERDGAPIAIGLGERCSGNTSCTPICPIQAKYSALKTLAQARRTNRLEIRAQAVASRIHVDPISGAVQSIEYQRYDDPSSPRHLVQRVTGRAYVLAAHAVENAKLMLVSGLGGQSGYLGRHLMDHPTLYAWGLSPVPIGAYRGPLSTSGIEDLRGGAFRANHAAFRFDIGNDGWRAATGAPDRTVAGAMRDGLFGRRLREHLASTLSRQVRFSLAIEQLPDADNRVSIDPRYRDPLGNPRPVIHYRIGEYTLAGMAAATAVYRAVFDRAGVTDCTDPAQSSWFPSVKWQGKEYHYHGMGHFAGTHLMGNDARQSVVDRDQRSWEHRNLYLIGSGSLPTMGTSNPTLTLAALAIRSAERLIAELGSM
jgi:choline dehydrogenase-like flavoprotein